MSEKITCWQPLSSFIHQSGRRDLNPRPLDPQAARSLHPNCHKPLPTKDYNDFPTIRKRFSVVARNCEESRYFWTRAGRNPVVLACSLRAGWFRMRNRRAEITDALGWPTRERGRSAIPRSRPRVTGLPGSSLARTGRTSSASRARRAPSPGIASRSKSGARDAQPSSASPRRPRRRPGPRPPRPAPVKDSAEQVVGGAVPESVDDQKEESS